MLFGTSIISGASLIINNIRAVALMEGASSFLLFTIKSAMRMTSEMYE